MQRFSFYDGNVCPVWLELMLYGVPVLFYTKIMTFQKSSRICKTSNNFDVIVWCLCDTQRVLYDISNVISVIEINFSFLQNIFRYLKYLISISLNLFMKCAPVWRFRKTSGVLTNAWDKRLSEYVTTLQRKKLHWAKSEMYDGCDKP